MKKQKSKSLILKQIMSETDEKLAAIPEFDASGTPIEFTTDYDMYIDGIANIKFIEGENHIHYPFDKTIALSTQVSKSRALWSHTIIDIFSIDCKFIIISCIIFIDKISKAA